jgi:hypothetical protein
MGKALPSGTPAPLTTASAPPRLVLDATNVYFIAAGADGRPAVLKVPRAGGSATEIFGHGNGLPTSEAPLALATDGAAVYVATSYASSATLYKVGLSGGGSRILPLSGQVTELLVDATSLYWIEGDQVAGAAIKQLPKP